MDIYELHQKMTAHLFPTYCSTDERFLALALCGEAGELANLIKKRWRDGVDLVEECRDEIADCRVYLELLAKCFDIEGKKLESLATQTAFGNPDMNSSKDSNSEQLMALALCARIGKLAFNIGARQHNLHVPNMLLDLICEQLSQVRVYLEIMAIIFGIEGQKLDQRVEQKLAKVVIKHRARLDSQGTPKEMYPRKNQ
jgi:NTP pyrophosphatase (non-canonical NTP hydrolase)